MSISLREESVLRYLKILKELVPNNDVIDSQDDHAIVVSKHGLRVAIGVPMDIVGGIECGAVYVIFNHDGRWVLEDKITPTERKPNMNFGESVDISSNNTLIVIGSPNEDNCGSVHVFDKKLDKWEEQCILPSIIKLPNQLFGKRVLLSEDNRILIILSPGYNDNCGRVYQYILNKDNKQNKEYSLRTTYNCIALDGEYNLSHFRDHLELDKEGEILKLYDENKNEYKILF